MGRRRLGSNAIHLRLLRNVVNEYNPVTREEKKSPSGSQKRKARGRRRKVLRDG